MTAPPNGWDKIEEDLTGPVKNPKFYNEMAHKWLFNKELKWVDKQITKAAMQGFFSVTIGILTADTMQHLKSLGFVIINENGVDTKLLF